MHALNSNAPLRVDKSFEMPSIPLVLTKILQVLDDDTVGAALFALLAPHPGSNWKN